MGAQGRLLPSVAFDANGTFIVTWTEYDADGTRVRARSGPGRYGARKVTLKTRATLYGGATDWDKLRLVCLPAS